MRVKQLIKFLEDWDNRQLKDPELQEALFDELGIEISQAITGVDVDDLEGLDEIDD